MKSFFDIGRIELKYYITAEQLSEVKELIAPFVEVDPYAKNRENNTYTIRSIYFDSREMDFYYEKMDGLKIRKKLRVRSYNEFLADGTAFLEIKRRYVNQIVKERTSIPLNQLDKICYDKENPINGNGNQWSKNGVVVNKFLYNLIKMDLEPMLLVTYDREAYIGRLDDSIRVTFDKNLRVIGKPSLSDLFIDKGFEYISPESIILELKFNGYMPRWMRTMVAKLHIQPESISKYCLGIDRFWN